MGKGTNQIATKGDLMLRGFVDIASSTSNGEAVIGSDLKNVYQNGGWAPINPIWKTFTFTSSIGYSELSKTIPGYTAGYFQIAAWNLPSTRGYYSFEFQGTNAVALQGSNNVNVYLALCVDSDNPISSPYTLLKTWSGINITNVTELNFSGLTFDFDNENHTKLTLNLLVVNNASYSTTFYCRGNIPTAARYLDLEKCVKYSVATQQGAIKYWYFSIYEEVAGKTSADTIKIIYRYQNTSGGTSYDVTASTVTLTDAAASNGSTSKTYGVDLDPKQHYSGTPTNARMIIYCGSTSANQTWKYRLKKRDNTWTGWYSLAKGKSVTVDPLLDSGLGTNGPFAHLLGDGPWLTAAYNFVGVEFHVT